MGNRSEIAHLDKWKKLHGFRICGFPKKVMSSLLVYRLVHYDNDHSYLITNTRLQPNCLCTYSNSKMTKIKDLIRLLRPLQWAKNGFVLIPLFFNGSLGQVSLLTNALVAFLCFSLVASSVYCFNDIHDVEADRLHRTKRYRPVASGAISVPMAYALMGTTFLLSLAIALFFFKEKHLHVIGTITFYYVMNIAYCVKLKQISLVDVFIIATGFVLRILLGSVVTGIELSKWIVVMTFLLALFLALAKRRDDVVTYKETGILPRKSISNYNLEFMNQAITVVGTITLVSYIMYVVSDEVMERLGSRYLYLTAVFVLAGILRYMQLAIVNVKSGSPTKVLMKDRFIQLCIAGWMITFGLIIYF